MSRISGKFFGDLGQVYCRELDGDLRAIAKEYGQDTQEGRAKACEYWGVSPDDPRIDENGLIHQYDVLFRKEWEGLVAEVRAVELREFLWAGVPLAYPKESEHLQFTVPSIWQDIACTSRINTIETLLWDVVMYYSVEKEGVTEEYFKKSNEFAAMVSEERRAVRRLCEQQPNIHFDYYDDPDR